MWVRLGRTASFASLQISLAGARIQRLLRILLLLESLASGAEARICFRQSAERVNSCPSEFDIQNPVVLRHSCRPRIDNRCFATGVNSRSPQPDAGRFG